MDDLKIGPNLTDMNKSKELLNTEVIVESALAKHFNQAYVAIEKSAGAASVSL